MFVHMRVCLCVVSCISLEWYGRATSTCSSMEADCTRLRQWSDATTPTWCTTPKTPRFTLSSDIVNNNTTAFTLLFGHLIRMDESADARRFLTAVPQSDWRRPVGWPHSSWMATLKNDLSLHNLTCEDAIEMALDKPLWGLLAASGATHWWCMPNSDDDDDDLHCTVESKDIEPLRDTELLTWISC